MTAAAITGASVPRLARGVRLREDAARGGRWVVMAPERLFVPDATALEVLRLVDGARSVEAIVDALAARFDAPRAEIAADVTELLEDLAAKGVIVT
ncbi:pyrroloquinoline quinone biosynthesis peptide chaperone PqqD [Caldovatus aquaticus]|uniref:Pyrroloquinoline quinone biosynthesis peptide chaperone PqqD n=1 Tax=Caldovatus aquaticus TaxID=2865671 RepID=A0ABS7F7D6_9PROT|nr:pyrroloquinoline quinone biosynthesis peptide chaperone PqqD [Caldovatus aquaticus]